MSSPRAGAILGGRYRLVRPLAAGGMGTVWLAHHIDLEVDVAVKLIDGDGTRRPDLLERFRREARAAAQLKTPHVVQILDFGVDDGTPYIAMELLQGVDLDTHLEEQSTLSPERTLAIVRPLCKALEAAHAVGIVHRDLKPANVFIARIGGDEVVKIVDFGIAKELHRGAEWSTGTAMVGSPLFMSPEQIRGSGHVDARTDVWALAVMAYLMLFGEPPFQGDGLPAIFYNIAHGPFVAPSARSPALAPLDPFFDRGLARDVAHRYQTVGELLAGLEHAVRQLPAPSLAVSPSAAPCQEGTLASAGSPHVAPATTPPVPHQHPLPSAPPPSAVSGHEGTVSAFDSSPRPAAPVGALARARSDTMAPGTPGSARPLVIGGAAIVVAVIGFVVLRGGGGVPSPAPAVAPAVSSVAEATSTTPPAVLPSAAQSASAAVSAAPSAVASAPPTTIRTPGARAPQRPAGSAAPARPGPSSSSPAKPSGSAPPKQTTVDPEWGVPVQR